MKAIWNGLTIAESETTRDVHGYTYFPRDAVRMDLLKTAAKTASDLECPHGVQFYDVGDGKQRSARAAWSYEAPTDATMRTIDRWMSFWDDVEVRA